MECTLRQVFQTHFETYAKRHRLPAYVHRAAYWISRCRTAELGGHVRRCPEGHVERAFYNSCHQRGCPQCQALATEQWLERQRARLIACAHHHLIFTIPHELNALWCWNVTVNPKIPTDSSRERLRSLLNGLRRKKWNVHIRPRYAHGAGVAAYLARYLKGGPLKNTQLIEVRDDRIAFRYHQHRDEADGDRHARVMTLTPEAFLARYLEHTAEPRLQAVRGYGLYGQRKASGLDQARSALGQAPVEAPKPISARH